MIANVRRAQTDDYAAVNELETSLVDLAADRRAAFDAVLASPDHDLLVADLDGEVVGFVHLMTYQELSHGALACELLGIMVRSDCRRRGIGRMLFAEAVRLARQRAAGELNICTEPDNDAAKRFYAAMGAEVVSVQFELEMHEHT